MSQHFHSHALAITKRLSQYQRSETSSSARHSAPRRLRRANREQGTPPTNPTRPSVQRRPPRRVQRSRCPVRRAPQAVFTKHLSRHPAGRAHPRPLSNLTRDRSRGTVDRTQGTSERTPPGNSFCDDSPPSPTFLLGQNHRRIMQNLDRPAFCQPCQKPTQHQIRYRSDPTS